MLVFACRGYEHGVNLSPEAYACGMLAMVFIGPISVLREYEQRFGAGGRMLCMWWMAWYHTVCMLMTDAVQETWRATHPPKLGYDVLEGVHMVERSGHSVPSIERLVLVLEDDGYLLGCGDRMWLLQSAVHHHGRRLAGTKSTAVAGTGFTSMQGRVKARKKNEQDLVTRLRRATNTGTRLTREERVAEGDVQRTQNTAIDGDYLDNSRPSPDIQAGGCRGRQPEVGKSCHGLRWDSQLTRLSER
ncbi:hypothetical protein C6341_g23353 [Phytophthora cactorum]|nr:hypothetical protein C6341_g23353 [Phytophthora cactorum]